MENVKRIPYGVSDFVDIIKRNQYYVDKTMYIPKLEEEADSLFFIRPRRFGKSLLLSMMCAYYDINQSDRFEELFGKLWIGSHPTPYRGKFQVLFLDFSKIGGDIKDLKENFNNYCNIRLDNFIERYKRAYRPEIVEKIKSAPTAVDKLNMIDTEAKDANMQLYLIIDEYDNFTNVVLNEHGEKVYWALTHAKGFYREIFKVFKGMFTRIFMTGVSPVTLDDLTSGFNIGWHISTKPAFNQMLGFSAEDVREMFEYFKSAGKVRPDCDVESVIAEMKPWYDNYCFSKNALQTQSKVFNCDMVLYYLRNYAETGEAPEEMIDPNTKTDYNKMKKLLQLDKLDGNRKGVILEIAEKGKIISNLETTFPAETLTNPNMFVSLLFYYGMLTIKGTRGSRLILGIPNNNVRKQYYEYLLEQYEEKASLDTNQLEDYFYDMAYDGKWHDALQFLADSYAKVSSVRDGIEAERNIQGFFMAYLNLNAYYMTAPELELNHGYCDFFLLPDLTHYASKHCYILELKLIPKKEKGMSQETYEAAIQQQWDAAEVQIKHYAEAPRVEALRQGTQLHKIIMQFDGWKLFRMDEVN
ncbi:AAA family ATPase [Segatella hominis]|uniref:ATP-binding protein n=1 Tax=Segatella hominis TaxID=2518605 RepID=UPI001C47FC10|nr:ATP-binding protein [Segatella hominis]WOZ80111.1 AAA family ATPase [Segatella hominis]